MTFRDYIVLAAESPTSLAWVTPQARPAQNVDVRELSRTLARAFYDDPVMTWLLPDDKARTAQLSRLFATMTRYHHLSRGGVEVACDGPGVGAAALWDPPNQWRETHPEGPRMNPAVFRVVRLRPAEGRGGPGMSARCPP